MAYTNAPTTQTYKPVRIKFDGISTYRSGDLTTQRDINTINFYYERVSQENQEREVALKKRPGLTTTAYSLTKGAASDVLRGYFYDADQNAFYWAVNNKVYNVTPDVGTSVRTVCTLNTSSGYVGFCSYLQSTNTRYVIFSDGTDLWVDNYAATSCARVTDADMPTPHVPCPLYLDGYIFLIKSSTGDIYNSNVDDPTLWTAGDFITAEMGSDYALKLAKTKNYIVCFGYNTMEFFWDAGNASGSPLSRNDAPFRNVGYVTGMSQLGDKIYFVGQQGNQNLAVYELDGFKLSKISNSVVDRSMQAFSSGANVKSKANLNRDGHMICIDGHNFYVLSTTQTTWVYDLDNKFWYEWKGSDSNGLAIEAVWNMYNGGVYMAIGNQTVISNLTQGTYQDFGANYNCVYTTEKVDAGTLNIKFCARATIIADQTNASTATNLTLDWSDDDWASTTGTRTVNLTDSLPCTRQLGKFRERSFRITYADNYPLRMTGIELDINVGAT